MGIYSPSSCIRSCFDSCMQLAQLLTIIHGELECGPMPNVMAAQPNIGGAVPKVP